MEGDAAGYQFAFQVAGLALAAGAVLVLLMTDHIASHYDHGDAVTDRPTPSDGDCPIKGVTDLA